MNKLTETRIRKITGGRKPQRYGDGYGLMLLVQPSGRKSWVQRLTLASGQRTDLGLGPWPVVTLAEARDTAIDNLRAVRRGEDPRADKRKAAAMPTFQQAADAYFASRPDWSAGVRRGNQQQIAKHCAALLDRPVDTITQVDAISLLAGVMRDTYQAGRKLRGLVRNVLAWAQAQGHVSANVADSRIDAALPRQAAPSVHHSALPWQDVPAALRAVKATQGANLAAVALMEFVILTACRSGEARLAQWSEIDTAARTWTIPAARTKTRKAHRVALSDAALSVLDRVRPLRDVSGLVFPSPSRAGRPLNQNALQILLRRAGIAAVPHGFRSSFRDWAGEKGHAREVAEAALAHVVGGVEGAYARSDLLERRRPLMQAWAAHVGGSPVSALRVA